MQDKAIAAIGRWQLDKLEDLEEVDLYIENMFPGKDWQMLLLIFEIKEDTEELKCEYKGMDIENVRADDDGYRKYAYRKGPARGGDVTLSTKLSYPVDKKLKTIKEITFKKILKSGVKEEYKYFELIKKSFNDKEQTIKEDIVKFFNNIEKNKQNTTGLSFKIVIKDKEKYLRDFETIKKMIVEIGIDKNYNHSGTVSKEKNKISSVSGERKDEIYGFAAPFKYSSPDKPGFISGFFNKKKNWRNYPIGADETLVLELGRKFIQQNLTGYFYSHEYMIIPNPIIKNNKDHLERVITLLQTAFNEEKNVKKEQKKYAEDRILKIIAAEKNYFNLDILFYKEDKITQAITIDLMMEEILPSRFRTLFIDVPEKVNNNKIYKNAITIKKEQQDLVFNYGIVKEIFDKSFLEVVNKLFLGEQLSRKFVFERIMAFIRKKYNDSKTKDRLERYWIILKAIMLLHYLHDLNIIANNKNYRYMEIENNKNQKTSFNLDKFNEFVSENKHFLDSDIKIGIFAVGVLVRYLFDIQKKNLNNTPFESKLHGYKLNPELLMYVYTEALDKIQKYQKNFYVYQELRDVISKYFVVKFKEIKDLTNNELSFYFVAGIELGKEFKLKETN
ncbi:MAG: TIGR02556 family CRISPR-associated protein [Marinilabiliales bacterium]